ncbi:unnamed protein product, partial [Laminaria digitata]
GSQAKPTAVCLDKQSQGFGEDCFTQDGCDCEVGRCNDGACPAGAQVPAPPLKECKVDLDCESGCCASTFDPSLCS